MLFAQLEKAAEQLPQDKSTWLIIGAVVLGAIVLVAVLRSLLAGGRKPVDPEQGLGENLRDYPPAPGVPSSRRLTVHGVPVRLRLVVVAPTGRQQEDISPDKVAGILDDIYHGLARFVREDRPRVKVWPPQLSVAGFAPTFHRLVRTPDPKGKPSRWVLVAGPAKIGSRPILVGLALYADEPVKLGQLSLEATAWPDVLRVR
jgi:hypothetical protein